MRISYAAPVAAIFLLGACGGGSNATTAGNSASTALTPTTAASAPANGGTGGRNGAANLTADQRAALTAYTDCLSANGVTLPRFGRNGGAANGAPNPGDGGPGGADDSSGASGSAISLPPQTGGTPAAADAGPGGRGAPVSIDPAVQAKAQEACKDKLPAGVDPTQIGRGGFGGGAGGTGGNGGGRGGFDITTIQAYASCLKDNGVNVPDLQSLIPTGPPTTVAGAAPDTSGNPNTPGNGGGRRGGPLQAILTALGSDPNFATANTKCSPLLPAATNGTAPTTTAKA